MALPDELSPVCPLCGQTFQVKVSPVQTIITGDSVTGEPVVTLVVNVEAPTHSCYGVPGVKKPAAAKKTTRKKPANGRRKKTTAKKTTAKKATARKS